MFMIPMGGWWTRRHIPWHDECIYGAWRPVPYPRCGWH